MLSLYLLLHSLPHTPFCVFLSDEVSHVAQASPLAPLLPLLYSPSVVVLFCDTHSFCLPTFLLSIFPKISYDSICCVCFS